MSTLNIFRVNNLQRLYFFIDDFKFHNYHQVEYDGELKALLDMILTFQENVWNMFSFVPFLSWLSEPFDIDSYEQHTNSKFRVVEKGDSFFLQRTKKFFLLNLPMVLLSFFLLNRLFYCVFHLRVSCLLRAYSFWFNLVLVLVVQNVASLSFYACHHFRHMFSFSFTTKVFQVMSVAVIGLLLFFALTFFYLCQYFYPNLRKNFLANMYNIEGAFSLMLVRFVLNPIA